MGRDVAFVEYGTYRDDRDVRGAEGTPGPGAGKASGPPIEAATRATQPELDKASHSDGCGDQDAAATIYVVTFPAGKSTPSQEHPGSSPKPRSND